MLGILAVTAFCFFGILFLIIHFFMTFGSTESDARQMLAMHKFVEAELERERKAKKRFKELLALEADKLKR